MATNAARTIQGEVHYCRFCGLPVSGGESHGTEIECIEALRREVEGRSAARVRHDANNDREKDKHTRSLATV